MISTAQNQPLRPRTLIPLALPLVMGGLLVLLLLGVLGRPAAVQAADGPFFATDIMAVTGIVDDQANFTSTGDGPGTLNFGFAVAPAGDVNGDGYSDVVVGADVSNKAYIYIGSSQGLTNPAYFTATGPLGSLFGTSVGGGGGVNDDNFDDFVVGAPKGETTGFTDTGIALVYYGAGIGLPTLAVTLSGEIAGDNFGWSVDVVGDLNNDGFADVAVGAPNNDGSVISPTTSAGRVYIYYGSASGVAATPSYTLTGASEFDGLGVSVAGAGDVNGDGIDDLAVGAWGNSSTTEAGKAYVFYGSPTGINRLDFTVVQGEPGNLLGTSVHGAGDVNGDGFDDVIVGSDTSDPATPTVGLAYVFHGGISGLITTPIFSAVGETVNDKFGFAVGGQGDVNGDGFDDIFIGAYQFDVSGPLANTGKVYGYGGCLGGIAPGLIFSATGESFEENYGRSLNIVGDVNGDSVDDLVVGAFGGKDLTFGPPGVPTGRIYAYYGQDEGGCRTAVQVDKRMALANFPAALPFSTQITVPNGTVIAYRYTVTNTGNLPLTHHRLVDVQLGVLVPGAAVTLTPGMSYTVVFTGVPATSASVVATWTGAVTPFGPGGAVPNPASRVISASAVASAIATISGPALDQDGDTIPDQVELSRDTDGDGFPDYLDTNSDNDNLTDLEESGNPLPDLDGDGIPSYRDPNEVPKPRLFLPALQK